MVLVFKDGLIPSLLKSVNGLLESFRYLSVVEFVTPEIFSTIKGLLTWQISQRSVHFEFSLSMPDMSRIENFRLSTLINWVQ